MLRGRSAVVQEAYVHGVSTCKVDDLAKALGWRVSAKAGSPSCARGRGGGQALPQPAAGRLLPISLERRHLIIGSSEPLGGLTAIFIVIGPVDGGRL